MRIALVAPLIESCPPRLYGGTERVVSILADELVRQGHAVTLFASGDSRTRAELVPCSPVGLRLDPTVRDALPHHLRMLELVRRRVGEFDILHFHIDLLHYPLAELFDGRMLTTLHGRLDLPDLQPFYATFSHLPVVSISDDQRRPLPQLNWLGTVHHGLPAQQFAWLAQPRGDYLAFVGRISPEKRPDRAIEIARRAGMPLKIAAKIDTVDRAYWDEVIHPLVAGQRDIEFVGEIDDRAKGGFLGNARALLFPIDWPEPFGMVMIEAMACGTPVIAFANGSVPEVIEPGVSGFVVRSVAEAVDAVRHVPRLDRRGVRAAFDARFTAERMTRDYVAVYRRLLGLRRTARGEKSGADLQVVA